MMLNDTGDVLWELGQLLGHVRPPRLHRHVCDRLRRARPRRQANGEPDREWRRERARGARRDEPHLPRRPSRRGHPGCWSWSTWSRSPSFWPHACPRTWSIDQVDLPPSKSSAGSSSSCSATSFSPSHRLSDGLASDGRADDIRGAVVLLGELQPPLRLQVEGLDEHLAAELGEPRGELLEVLLAADRDLLAQRHRARVEALGQRA